MYQQAGDDLSEVVTGSTGNKAVPIDRDREEASPVNRKTLTALYLAEVSRRGLAARDLVGSQINSELLNSFYQGRYLARPLFLGQGEHAQLESDLVNLRSALVSLPDRLYGGDIAPFARDVGMNELQISAIKRTRGTTVTSLTRADMYLDAAGFRLLELNMGSALGGMDNADMAVALLEHPVLAEFAREHRLEYVDTMREEVGTILAEAGFAPGDSPTMVMTDWPSSYEYLEPYLRAYAVRLSQLGLDAHAAHIGQLTVRDGRVWLEDKPIDIIYRVFTLEELMESDEAPALMDPVLDAVAAGQVKLFTSMDAEMFASKGALAVLSDEKNRGLFSPAELASLDRILPWTRMVRPGPVTLEDGKQADLLEYALSHQEDLALKPTWLHGGQGVLLGWRRDTSPQGWEEAVRAAMDGPFVIQRRIRPEPELFQGEDGKLTPWIVCWSPFTMLGRCTGFLARAASVESEVEVINVAGGKASVTSCLHVRSGTGLSGQS